MIALAARPAIKVIRLGSASVKSLRTRHAAAPRVILLILAAKRRTIPNSPRDLGDPFLPRFDFALSAASLMTVVR